MQEYDWSKKRQERPPLWQSGEGRLRESAPQAKKEGKEHLTGYRPSHREQERGAQPREAARLSSSFGDVAVGVSRKKEITMVVSKRRGRDGPAALEDEKTLNAQSARRIGLARGNFRVNSHDPQKSAVAFQEKHQKPPEFFLARVRELMRTHEQDTLREQIPFLSKEKERKELKELKERADALRAHLAPGDRAALREIESRKQYLQRTLAEKTAMERRLRLSLEKAEEESRRRAGEAEMLPQLVILSSEQEGAEPPPTENGASDADSSAAASAEAGGGTEKNKDGRLLFLLNAAEAEEEEQQMQEKEKAKSAEEKPPGSQRAASKEETVLSSEAPPDI